MTFYNIKNKRKNIYKKDKKIREFCPLSVNHQIRGLRFRNIEGGFTANVPTFMRFVSPVPQKKRRGFCRGLCGLRLFEGEPADLKNWLVLRNFLFLVMASLSNSAASPCIFAGIWAVWRLLLVPVPIAEYQERHRLR